MSREILLLAEALASEKNVQPEIVFSALEFALASATKKKDGREHMDVRTHIDRETGDYESFRRWKIVADEDYTYPDVEMTIEEIQEKFPDTTLEIGQYHEEKIDNVEFGRIGAQAAKQVILQRIRDAEREQILNEFLQRRESMVLGTVKRMERHGAIIEVGRLEALLPKDQMIPKEQLRSGDRVRALLLRVEQQGTRPVVILSRTSPEFLVKLFEMEVPEIEDGLLEIREVARDPGLRAKIAVKANDARIDPQGTCIGMRGSRVNAVTNELAGERVDVVLWSPETAQFVINALSPATVSRIRIDEDTHSVDAIVAEDQLAQAIGSRGQNVRLAAELTGWNLNILTVEEADERYQAEDAKLRQLFENALGIDEELAEVLVQEGFASLEEVAYVPLQDMLSIEGFDEDLANHLRSRARDALLTQALDSEEKLRNADETLKNLEGMDDDMLRDFLDARIENREDLAELSVDEVIEITGISTDAASRLILKARAHWFEDENEAGAKGNE